eukprot:scaffold13393_cov260-Alexandrium_tamarense.AAC.5
MVEVDPAGILKCVDGRGSDNTRMAGPKMPGGIYAIAHNRGTTSVDGLKEITKEVASKGHVPSVHGDHSADMLGCGFFRLWVTGEFDSMGYPRPEFDADQGAAAVKESGGVIEMHHGSHTEKGDGILSVESGYERDVNARRALLSATVLRHVLYHTRLKKKLGYVYDPSLSCDYALQVRRPVDPFEEGVLLQVEVN